MSSDVPMLRMSLPLAARAPEVRMRAVEAGTSAAGNGNRETNHQARRIVPRSALAGQKHRAATETALGSEGTPLIPRATRTGVPVLSCTPYRLHALDLLASTAKRSIMTEYPLISGCHCTLLYAVVRVYYAQLPILQSVSCLGVLFHPRCSRANGRARKNRMPRIIAVRKSNVTTLTN